jgi:hypothetical protein
LCLAAVYRSENVVIGAFEHELQQLHRVRVSLDQKNTVPWSRGARIQLIARYGASRRLCDGDGQRLNMRQPIGRQLPAIRRSECEFLMLRKLRQDIPFLDVSYAMPGGQGPDDFYRLGRIGLDRQAAEYFIGLTQVLGAQKILQYGFG